jgi:hypothetical protein
MEVGQQRTSSRADFDARDQVLPVPMQAPHFLIPEPWQWSHSLMREGCSLPADSCRCTLGI